MIFRLHLLLARLSLVRRALRVWASATLLRLASLGLAASKRLGTAAPDPSDKPEIVDLKSAIPPSPMTVEELISTARRWPSAHFVLRMPGLLIEISRVNEALETAAFNSGSEGHPAPRGQHPFFLNSHRYPSDKTTEAEASG